MWFLQVYDFDAQIQAFLKKGFAKGLKYLMAENLRQAKET